MVAVWSSEGVHSRLLCLCGDWEFRRRDAVDGLGVIERTCPRCENRILIIWRDGEVVGGVELETPTASGLRDALVASGEFDEDEVESLVRIAVAQARRGRIRLSGD